MGRLILKSRHRVLCGDSTNPADVARLMDGEIATLCHADPPYGMGKESEGVANDNLYDEKLDEFQMAWWAAVRPYIAGNASAYIWGNADGLWRLWYRRLEATERMTWKNQIIWDKPPSAGPTGSPIGSAGMRCYPHGYEVCLFFMLGEQSFGNVNKDDYWEGFEPIRGYLAGEVERAGFKAKDVERITGVGMYSHWFSKSQWTMIPQRHYESLKAASEGRAFQRPYPELRALYDGTTASGEHLGVKQQFNAMRAYFDNTHDMMTDVWDYPRVTGDDRHGHATPKPVKMIGRILKSSARPGEVIVEPFLGSGSTLIAAEQTGRRCFAMELSPAYCDVSVRRWQNLTGEYAHLLTEDADVRSLRPAPPSDPAPPA